MNLDDYKLRELISPSEINGRNEELARRIDHDYVDKLLTVIIITNGGLFFGADLIRLLTISLKYDILSVSSYVGMESSCKISMRSEIKLDINGTDVLIVDDILDTGRTLSTIQNYLKEFEPRSIRSCVLLEKNKARSIQLKADYTGFKINDRFVVGYGLDYDELFRNLPYIAVLEKSS